MSTYVVSDIHGEYELFMRILERIHFSESWWPEEMPSDLEYSEGLKNLERAGNRVDYILTHTCPGHVAHQLVTEIYSGEEQLQQYLDEISQSVEFEMWYFGHWHMDEVVEGRYVCLWNEIVELEE